MFREYSKLKSCDKSTDVDEAVNVEVNYLYPSQPRRHLKISGHRILIQEGGEESALTSPAYVSIRQHTSAYVSIRQHTSAYVSRRQHTSAYVSNLIQEGGEESALTSPADVSIRQQTSAYVSIRQHTSAILSKREVKSPP